MSFPAYLDTIQNPMALVALCKRQKKEGDDR